MTVLQAIISVITNTKSSRTAIMNLRKLLLPATIFAFALATAGYPAPDRAAEKTIIGQVENVAIGKKRALFIAKIDTGAENSSLHARDVKFFTSRGKQWVSFRILNKYGKAYNFKKKVVRMATIKQKSSPDQQRPVVSMDMCLGKVHKTVEVNLVDRGNFSYAFLVGKSFLSGDFIVDVDKSFSIDPACANSKPK